MQKACTYGFGRTVDLDYESAMARVVSLFRERDFGILFQVDMRDTLRQGAGLDFRRYMIIGACPPAVAHRAFSADANIGLLLPCKVVVYEEEGGRSTVMAMDPAYLMDLVRVPEAIEVAIEIKDQLEAIVGAV